MKKGFTLLELLLVLCVIALLAGMLGSAGCFIFEYEKRQQAKAELAMLGTALESFYLDHGFYPVATNLYFENECVKSSAEYRSASGKLFLALLGRRYWNGDQVGKEYLSVKEAMVFTNGTEDGKSVDSGNEENYKDETLFGENQGGLKDPWGNPYAYYRSPDGESMFGMGRYDLWTTCGSSNTNRWLGNWN